MGRKRCANGRLCMGLDGNGFVPRLVAGREIERVQRMRKVWEDLLRFIWKFVQPSAHMGVCVCACVEMLEI